jgi:hypothetical protein
MGEYPGPWEEAPEEEGRPERGLRRPEEERTVVPMAGPREGTRWRELGMGDNEETLTPTALRVGLEKNPKLAIAGMGPAKAARWLFPEKDWLKPV